MPNLASEMSQDLPFLQGLLEKSDMSLSSLHQYVLVLARKSEIIEDDLINRQLDNSCEETKDLTSSCSKSNTRSTALKRIVSILNQWTASKDSLGGGGVAGEHSADELNVGRLLDCCRKHIDFTE
ncbi:hypothetical protein OIU78_008899 [Salix suchowensis]|nr:hypothetical protein OIU78_008899 [Salix suchowensis]